MTTTVLVGFALLMIGGTGGFVLARLRRSAAPRPVPAVVVETPDEVLPTLPPFRHALHDPQRTMQMPVAYDAGNEDEDDIPTALYRHDDEEVEALLAEFDTGHDRR
ncbi:MAG: hypothetical protein ABMA64_13185 [Myxococcota bacterium]